MGHSALCLLKILYGNPRPGVADGYSLSRPHGDLLSRDFPAVRDGESADTVIIDGDVLGGNAVLLFRMVHVGDTCMYFIQLSRVYHIFLNCQYLPVQVS